MMKKLLLLLCLGLLFQTNTFAESREAEKIEVEKTCSNKGPRSVIQLPKVWLDREQSELEVAFSSDDDYTLKVVDAAGAVLCQLTVITDGSKHPYSLPALDAGSYYVVLESNAATYEGGFDI